MKKTLAALALAGLALAGCGSPIPDSEPVDAGPATHVLTEQSLPGTGSLGSFLEDYAEVPETPVTDAYLDAHEPSTLDSFLDHYVPEEGK